jgi:hypothetical protein
MGDEEGETGFGESWSDPGDATGGWGEGPTPEQAEKDTAAALAAQDKAAREAGEFEDVSSHRTRDAASLRDALARQAEVGRPDAPVGGEYWGGKGKDTGITGWTKGAGKTAAVATIAGMLGGPGLASLAAMFGPDIFDFFYDLAIDDSKGAVGGGLTTAQDPDVEFDLDKSGKGKGKDDYEDSPTDEAEEKIKKVLDIGEEEEEEEEGRWDKYYEDREDRDPYKGFEDRLREIYGEDWREILERSNV